MITTGVQTVGLSCGSGCFKEKKLQCLIERRENSDRKSIEKLEIKMYGVQVNFNVFFKWLTQFE